MKFWVPKKLAKSVPKCIKKGNKKVNEKNIHFFILFRNLKKNIVFYRSEWALWRDYIVFYSDICASGKDDK